MPRKSQTNYKAKMGKGFLTVEAIWFLAKSHVINPKAAHAAYMKEALSAKFAQISLIDRKDLLDYLTGKVDTSANVDVTVPAFTVPDDYAGGVPQTVAGEKKRRRGEVGDGAGDGDGDALGFAGGARGGVFADGMPNEQPLHTRNSILQCNKDFSSVLGFFGQVVAAGARDGGGGGGGKAGVGGKGAHRGGAEAVGRENNHGGRGGGGGFDGRKEAPVPEVQPLRTNRFDRQQDDFWSAAVGKDFADLGIDTNASFLDSKKSGGTAGGAAGAARGLPQMSAQDAAALHAAGRDPANAAPSGRRGGGGGGGARPGTGPVGGVRKDPSAGAMPLIIVPAGYGSKVLFNMYNVAEFLANEKFITWDSCHKAGQKKHSSIIFKRRYKRDRSVKYEVTDKAPHKRSEDWARVVAVFVSGKEWQFKDWPFRGADDGDLVDTFQKIRGFYPAYDTDKTLEIIKTWNVKVLRFQKNVRHGDRAQFEALWEEIDKHLEIRQSRLAY